MPTRCPHCGQWHRWITSSYTVRPSGQRSKFGRRSLRQFVASSQAAFTVIANCEYWELSQLGTTRPRITGPPGLRGYPRAMLANRATAYVGICRIRTSAHAWKRTWVNSRQSRCNAAACDTQPAGVHEARVKPEKTAQRSMARNWHKEKPPAAARGGKDTL